MTSPLGSIKLWTSNPGGQRLCVSPLYLFYVPFVCPFCPRKLGDRVVVPRGRDLGTVPPLSLALVSVTGYPLSTILDRAFD